MKITKIEYLPVEMKLSDPYTITYAIQRKAYTTCAALAQANLERYSSCAGC